MPAVVAPFTQVGLRQHRRGKGHLVVLLLTLGTIIAAGIPLIAALTGVAVVGTGTTALAAVTQVSSAAVTVALMLALACGIDYALSIVHRHRTQLEDGIAPEESVSRAVGTAGSSVVSRRSASSSRCAASRSPGFRSSR